MTQANLNLAINAVKGGMDAQKAAQKYGVSLVVLNNAITKALVPNPLGFQGDTYNSKAYYAESQQKDSSEEGGVLKTIGKMLAFPFALFFSCGGQDEIKNEESTINCESTYESSINYDSKTKKAIITINNVKIELTEKDTELLRKQFEAEITKTKRTINELKTKVKTFKDKDAIERVNSVIRDEEDKIIRLENLVSWFGGKTPQKALNPKGTDFQTVLVLILQIVSDNRQLERLDAIERIIKEIDKNM